MAQLVAGHGARHTLPPWEREVDMDSVFVGNTAADLAISTIAIFCCSLRRLAVRHHGIDRFLAP
jgi:hypothetical protein